MQNFEPDFQIYTKNDPKTKWFKGLLLVRFSIFILYNVATLNKKKL